MKIAELFPSTRDIYRPIEKVITYAASQEARLKAEVTEYIVTESIEEQFEELLGKMQLAMEQGGQNEVGVWVSGFYGSGAGLPVAGGGGGEDSRRPDRCRRHRRRGL